VTSDDRDGVPVSVAWILIAALAAAIFLTNAMRAPKSSDNGIPLTANGLPVVTVPDAIEVQGLEAGSDVALSGWFQQSFPVPCPKPADPIVPLLNGNCTIDTTWLMAEPEAIIHVTPNSMRADSPTSPAIHPVFDGPGIDWARPLPQNGDSEPTPVVFIGHFDDERAAGCRPEDLQRCLDRFVVTEVTWADGVDNP
jgi:hypothetical protein